MNASPGFPFPVLPAPPRPNRTSVHPDALLAATRTPPSMSVRRLAAIFLVVALLHGLALLLVKLASGGEVAPNSGPNSKRESTLILSVSRAEPPLDKAPDSPTQPQPNKEPPTAPTQPPAKPKSAALDFGVRLPPVEPPTPAPVAKSSDAATTSAVQAEPPRPAEVGATPANPAPASPTKLPVRTEADRQIARQWLGETNRPSVVVTYDPADIVHLLQRRRGTLLASEPKPAIPPGAVFCLAGPPQNGRGDFVDAAGLASSLANFGIVVHPDRGSLATLAADLPAYFGSRPFMLQFIPDHALAEVILTEVSRAFRALGRPVDKTDADLVVEGRLIVSGGEARFVGQRLRTARGETPIAAD